MNKESDINKWLTLLVVSVGSFMTTMDISIVNIALPNMAKKLSTDIGTIQWVVTSYLLVISTLVLVFGRIADIKGKKIVYQNGFLVFSLGSLFCVISHNIGFLIISRIMQAIGASMMMSCNFGIITMSFSENERGRAVGILGTVVAIGTMTGPPLGGLLVGAFNWQSIFIINIPIGIAAYIAGVRILPKEENINLTEHFDLKGAFLYSTAIIPLFFALLSGEKMGWNNKVIIFCFIISCISIISFTITEKNSSLPMLDFNLFRNKLFSSGILCAFISYAVIYFTNIIQPFYLQNVLHMSPQKSGIIMIVYPATAALVAPVSGYLSDKIGYKLPTLLGLLSTAIGVYSMSFLTANSPDNKIIIRMAILGLGYGLFQSPNSAGVMSSVPKNKLGISGSINSLTRNVGMVFGISLSVALFYNRMSIKLGQSVNSPVSVRPDIFIYSMKFVYTSAAILALVGIITALLRLIDRKNRVI